MLLRSSSTGVLTSLVSVGPAHAESVLDLHCDQFSPVGKNSVPSTPTHALSSTHIADDARSIDGGDWEFGSGGNVPWPRFRKVQSESDLQSLCRASSNSSSVFAAADSLLRAPAVAPEPEVVEPFSGVKKLWSRRTKNGIRRGCSLSVIPSARHMEIDDSITELAESLTPVSTMGDSEEYQESPRYLSQSSSSIRRQFSEQSTHKLHREFESSPSSSFSSISKSRFETTWEDVNHKNDYVVSSLAAEFASFSGRLEPERQAGEAASMSVTVEAAKVGVMFGSQRGSVAHESFGPMYITDVGIGNGGNGGAYKVSGGGSEGGTGDTRGAEAHYRKQLETDPENALLLRNYAKFLHEVLKDPHRAEVYYERAILANPTDGEVLGAYAKLIWDVYKDEDRAGRYFEQALEATPDDCYLNAAYAAFLWSSEDGPEEEENPGHNFCNDSYVNHPSVYGTAAAASA